MKLIIDIPALTPRILTALGELHSATEEAKGVLTSPTDQGQYVNWEAVEKGKAIASQLVSDWSIGWSEDFQNHKADVEPADKGEIIAKYKTPDLMGPLYAYLKSGESSTQNLIDAGASPGMAGNIITIGGVYGAWPTKAV